MKHLLICLFLVFLTGCNGISSKSNDENITVSVLNGQKYVTFSIPVSQANALKSYNQKIEGFSKRLGELLNQTVDKINNLESYSREHSIEWFKWNTAQHYEFYVEVNSASPPPILAIYHAKFSEAIFIFYKRAASIENAFLTLDKKYDIETEDLGKQMEIKRNEMKQILLELHDKCGQRCR